MNNRSYRTQDRSRQPLYTPSLEALFKRNILEPFCCLENTSCTFAALWPSQFPFICDPGWFCLVLSNSTRFMPSGTMTFNAMQMSEQFNSLVEMFSNQPISSFMCRGSQFALSNNGLWCIIVVASNCIEKK